MPGENTDAILFSSEFDPSDFNKGVTGMINGLKLMQAQQDSLNESITENEKKLAEQTEQLNKMKAATQAAGKETKDFTEDNKRMAAGMAIIVKQNQQLTETIAKQKEQLTSTAASVVDMQKKYEAAAAAIKKANETTGKTLPFDSTKIVQDVTKVKDAVIANGKAAVAGVASSVASGTNVVEAVTGSIGELGAAFGPLAAVGGAALGFIIQKLYELATAETDAQKAQKILIQSEGEATKAFADAGLQVQQMKVNIDLAKEGFLDKDKVVKEYNETIGKTTGLVHNIDEAEAELVKKGPAFIELMFLKAKAQGAYNAAVKEAEKAATAQLDVASNFGAVDQLNAIRKNGSLGDLLSVFTGNGISGNAGQSIIKGAEDQGKAAEKSAKETSKILFTEFEKIQKEAAIFAKDNGLNFFGDTKDEKVKAKAAKSSKEIANIYEQELLKLKDQIAAAAQKIFTNETTITAAVDEDFKKRALALDKAFSKGQLTAPQLASLKENLGNLQTLVLNKQISDFQQQRKGYLDKINADLQALNEQEAVKRIQLLQDDFEKERQTIIAETDKTANKYKQKRDQIIEDIKKNAASKGLQLKDVQYLIDNVTDVYSKLIDDVELEGLQKLEAFGFKVFQETLKVVKEQADILKSGVSIRSNEEIAKAANDYVKGTITYDAYQKELTKIARREQKDRSKIQRQELQTELEKITQALTSGFIQSPDGGSRELNGKEKKDLEKQKREINAQLSQLDKEDAEKEASKKKQDRDKRYAEFQQYTSALAGLVQNIGQAWLNVNEVEAKALDRSIRLQQRRVDAATKIAERGNATYLKLEQDRLNQLQVKQEANARRTLAINAAIQGSQLLVGITGAIAQIAKGGPLNIIAGIATIVGSLAAGYALVKSLQGNQPSFYVGTEDTGKGGNVDNKGGFAAILHPNERVVSAEDNKKLKGITNKELVNRVMGPDPAVMNKVIAMYAGKKIPGLNYSKLEEAANNHTTHDGKLVAMLMELNYKQEEQLNETKRLNKNIRNIKNSVNIDRHGLSISLMAAMEQELKSKKA